MNVRSAFTLPVTRRSSRAEVIFGLLLQPCNYGSMSRRKATPEELALNTFDDWLREITRCASEMVRIQDEYMRWSAANPQGVWPGAPGLIDDLQKRKNRAEARFADLTGSASR